MQSTGMYPRLKAATGWSGVTGLAGGLLLTETVRLAGLDKGLSAALAPWRAPRAVHDPGKALLDVALAVAAGGDCLADAALVRAEPGIYGQVASDPTVSGLFALLGKGSRQGGTRRRQGTRGVPGPRVVPGRRARPARPDKRHRSAGGRLECHAGDSPFGQAARPGDVQEGVRVPSVVRVR